MRQSVDVLLVDDNQADITLTLWAMNKEMADKRVHVARDGEEALNYILLPPPHSGVPAVPRLRLILLDLKLPKVSGFDVLAGLKNNSHTRLIPVVILSSSKHDNDVWRSYALGANSYLQKPVDFDKFRSLIRQVAGYWLQLNQAPVVPELIPPEEQSTVDLREDVS